MRALYLTSLVLSIIGAINWGLIGFFEFNLVYAILAGSEAASRVVYALVGIAGVVLAFTSAEMYRRLSPATRHAATTQAEHRPVDRTR